MSALPLFRTLLGPSWHALAPELRAFHSLQGRVLLHGECEVGGASTPLARWFARLARLPGGGHCAIAFERDAAPARERWTRRFGAHEMGSTLRLSGDRVDESLGPFVLRMRAHERDGALELELEGVRLLGVPLPRALWPRMRARETASPGRLHFDVAAGLPWVGTLVEYRGWLALPAGLPREDVTPAQAGV